MADVTMNSPTIPNITPATNDLILAWDASAGANGEFFISDLITLLELTFARLAGASFTGTVDFGSTTRLAAADAGAGPGRHIIIDRNNNATTPAPGAVAMRNASNSYRSIYPDNSGVLRIYAAAGITNDQINLGTVVGDQSSSLATKDILPGLSAIEEVYERIAQGAEAVRLFWYKESEAYDDDGNPVPGPRPYNGERFEGVIINFAPHYGKDRTEANPEGRSLNDIGLFGDLLRVVADLALRVAALEGA